MSLKCGIVGLPNVGKSTLFNALTKAGIAAENYPFCTIEPNSGIVAVPDKRLDKLAEIWTLLTQSPENFLFGNRGRIVEVLVHQLIVELSHFLQHLIIRFRYSEVFNHPFVIAIWNGGRFLVFYKIFRTEREVSGKT